MQMRFRFLNEQHWKENGIVTQPLGRGFESEAREEERNGGEIVVSQSIVRGWRLMFSCAMNRRSAVRISFSSIAP